jgi:hypothetical protein
MKTIQLKTSEAYYQIDPAIIHTIWNEKFNNTILATKEFEERLQYIHTLCSSGYLEVYLKNMNKPLYISDKICAGNASGDIKKKFLEFAARKNGGVMIAKVMQQKLSIYLQQKYQAYKMAAAKTWAKYQHSLDSLNNIADVKRSQQSVTDFERDNKNFREEFCINLTDAYKQIGKEHNCNDNILPPSTTYYNVNISSTGWKNLDVYVFNATQNRQSMTYTDSITGKTATITYSEVSITIENATQFDRVLVYLIPDSLSSFQRVAQQGNNFKEQLNALLKYEAIAVAYKGTQTYFAKEQSVQPKEYTFNLLPVTDDAFHAALNNYSLSKNKAFKIEMDYRLFEQMEVERQVQLQKEMQFREKIAASIFNCLSMPVMDSAASKGK